MTDRDPQRPRRRGEYPVQERGRRILWRTITIGIYAGLSAVASWVSAWLHWPFRLTLALVAFPYWSVVIAVWLRRGPYMPRLHGNLGLGNEEATVRAGRLLARQRAERSDAPVTDATDTT